MEMIIWLTQWILPLFGWWLILSHFQKITGNLQNQNWGASFQKDFLNSLLVTVGFGTPEKQLETLSQIQLPLRIRHLWLGLRSLSFALIFMLLFLVFPNVPTSVFMLLALALFIAYRWSPALHNFAFLVVGLGLFSAGFENLIRSASQWTQVPEADAWVFWLGENYLKGALIGLVSGFLIRAITRISGVSLWTGLSLLLAGVASLGTAWGFFLGDFLAGLIEDRGRFKERDFKLRFYIGIALGLVFLILSPAIQILVTEWWMAEYSVQLRSYQLALMVAVLLAVESFLALTFFHYYYQRHQND